jgi:hypothetical protein
VTNRRHFIYPVPDDFRTLLAVVNSVNEDREAKIGWFLLSASLVAVSSVTAAIYLRAAFEHRPHDIRGDSLLEPHEIWVEEEDRSECERLLAENCPSPAQWYDLIQVSFATEDDHRQFAAAYTRITGLRNAF